LFLRFAKLGIDSLAGEFYLTRTLLNEKVLREDNSTIDFLGQPSLYVRVSKSEKDIDIYGSGELVGLIGAILKYLDVHIDRGMEIDPHYPPPEPPLRPYIRLKSQKPLKNQKAKPR
jgi:hypothetical protein